MLLDGANPDATVTRSSFVKGSAYTGSAFSVINGASLAVSNSTVGENNTTLNFSGGAVSVEGAASTTSFNNVTFADNRTDSTNGATFALDATASPMNQEVANSIVQTMDPQNANCTVGGASAAAFDSLGHNIQFGGGSPDTPCAISPGPGDLTANPLLPGTFAFFAAADQNGYLPAAGSPAIDGGLDCDSLSGGTDQLGAARTQGAACDVGAIEQAKAAGGGGAGGSATFSLGKAKSKPNGSVKLPVTTTGAGTITAVGEEQGGRSLQARLGLRPGAWDGHADDSSDSPREGAAPRRRRGQEHRHSEVHHLRQLRTAVQDGEAEVEAQAPRVSQLAGAHVAPGKPLAEAEAIGADCVQIFLSDPQGWKKPPPREDAAELRASEVGIYVHAPYLINVCSPRNNTRYGSRKILSQTCEAAADVGAAAVIVHPGHAEDGIEAGYGRWVRTLEMLESEVPVYLENTAGGDHAVARRLRCPRAPLGGRLVGTDRLRARLLPRYLPRARGRRGSRHAVQRARGITGRIDLLHLNDSRDPAGTGADRHANLGKGEIGTRGPARDDRRRRRRRSSSRPGGARR